MKIDKNSEEYRIEEIRKYLEPFLKEKQYNTIRHICNHIYYLSTRIYIEPPTQEQLERTYQHLQIPHFTNY